MTYGVVQTVGVVGAGGVATTILSPSSTTAGDLVVVMLYGQTPSAITDNLSSTYTLISGTTIANMYIYYLADCPSGITTITITHPATSPCTALMREYSGVRLTSPLDVYVGASGTISSPPATVSSGNTSSTANANDLVIGIMSFQGGLTTPTVGSGFSNLFTETNSGFSNIIGIEDKAVSSTGAQAATATYGLSGAWYMACICFKLNYVVQTVFNQANSTGSFSTTIASTLAGDLLVIACPNDAQESFTVTDNLGSTYSYVSGAIQPTVVAYLANCPSGITTITATLGGSNADMIIGIREYSGVAITSPLDKTATAALGSATTAYNSGATATTTKSNELVVGVALQYTNTTTIVTYTAGSGFINLAQYQQSGGPLGDYLSMAFEDVLVTFVGAQTATFTASAVTGTTNSAECDVLTFIMAAQPATASKGGTGLLMGVG